MARIGDRLTIFRSVMLRSYPDRGPAWDDRLVDRWQDGIIHAEAMAAKEGYTLINATAVEPQLDNQWVFGVKMVVTPKHNARETGVPGCCGPATIPDHYPMPHCRSGKRPHCTCDGCF